MQRTSWHTSKSIRIGDYSVNSRHSLIDYVTWVSILTMMCTPVGSPRLYVADGMETLKTSSRQHVRTDQRDKTHLLHIKSSAPGTLVNGRGSASCVRAVEDIK